MNTERKIDLATGLLAEHATSNATDVFTRLVSRGALEVATVAATGWAAYWAVRDATQSAITDCIRHKG